MSRRAGKKAVADRELAGDMTIGVWMQYLVRGAGRTLYRQGKSG
jgi:hypothetical protein